jgi:hypothetical protein
MPTDPINFDDLRTQIIAAAIVRQVFDYMARNSEPPDDKRMEAFSEEAQEIARMAIDNYYT